MRGVALVPPVGTGGGGGDQYEQKNLVLKPLAKKRCMFRHLRRKRCILRHLRHKRCMFRHLRHKRCMLRHVGLQKVHATTSWASSVECFVRCPALPPLLASSPSPPPPGAASARPCGVTIQWCTFGIWCIFWMTCSDPKAKSLSVSGLNTKAYP